MSRAGATVKAGAVLAIIGSEAEHATAQPAADAAGNVELSRSAATHDAKNGAHQSRTGLQIKTAAGDDIAAAAQRQ